MTAKKGSVVIISLWITVILALCAVGLGRRGALAVRLADYQVERLKSLCLAKAGFSAACVELTKDRDENSYDHVNEDWSTGIDSATKTPLYVDQHLRPGDQGTYTVTGVFDEERTICINKNDAARRAQLFELLLKAGWTESRAGAFIGFLADFFSNNAPLAATEEFQVILENFYARSNDRLPHEAARQAYRALAGYVTVYTDGKVNINTASPDVLEIVMTALSKNQTVASLVDGDIGGLTDRIMAFRGSGGFFTKESAADIEASLAQSGAPLTDGQLNLIAGLSSSGLITAHSNIFRIESTGRTSKGIERKVTAVANRQEEPRVLFWHEN